MASLSITRGTTKTFLMEIENEDGADRTWEDYGTVLLRIKQDSTILDKECTILPNDKKVLRASFTQDETIKLREGKFKMQLFSIIGPTVNEIACKPDVMYGFVKESLWDEVIHND